MAVYIIMTQSPDEISAQVYDFIQAYIDEHGFAPTQREIALGCYMSKTNIIRYLDRLEMQGRIIRIPGQPRSIRLVA